MAYEYHARSSRGRGAASAGQVGGEVWVQFGCHRLGYPDAAASESTVGQAANETSRTNRVIRCASVRFLGARFGSRDLPPPREPLVNLPRLLASSINPTPESFSPPKPHPLTVAPSFKYPTPYHRIAGINGGGGGGMSKVCAVRRSAARAELWAANAAGRSELATKWVSKNRNETMRPFRSASGLS